ncbi:MAG: hypothetical protein R3B84_02740 [Zavarzinella sp.]
MNDMLLAQADQILDKARGIEQYWLPIAIGVGLLVVLIVLRGIARKNKKIPDLQRNLHEDLSSFPPPPAGEVSELFADGVPVRIRLIIIAPVGQRPKPIRADQAEDLLDDVLRGISRQIAADNPRIVIWPPQMSLQGFAATFHRLVPNPDGAQKKSRWLKMAGPAKTHSQPILLGLALLAPEEVKKLELHLDTPDWAQVLQIRRT